MQTKNQIKTVSAWVLFYTSLFSIAMLSMPASSAIGEEEIVSNIDMFVGEVRSLGQADVKRVAVGAGSVIRAEVVSGGELLVIAEGKGSSYLNLWYKNGTKVSYNIRVSESDPEERVLMKDMIRVKVRMVEVRKSATRDLGIDWLKSGVNGPTFGVLGDITNNNIIRPQIPAGLGQVALPAGDVWTTYFGIASTISSQLNFLATRGDAITVAEPTLTCVNGGSAKFLSGGEIPYSTVNANGQVNVEFKEYGIKLDIFPKASKEGNIYTRLVAELSQPDDARIIGGVPALLSRKTESQLNVRTGETIVISGLLSAEQGYTKDTVPGLGDIPIVGSLFSNKVVRNNLNELVLFVTPEVVSQEELSGNSRQQRLQVEANKRMQKLGKKLKYSILE